jgi:FkbM family methyltransferase
MLSQVVATAAARAPRGGYSMLRLCAPVLPSLKRYPIHLPRFGVTLDCDLTDNVTFPLLKYGCYPHQVGEEAIFAKYALNSRCIVDVGANIGYTAALFSSAAPQAQVFAFEPARRCLKYLQQIASQRENVIISTDALSDEPGSVEFFEHPSSDQSHLGEPNVAGGYSYRVPVTTLDIWRTSHPTIDLLKIDVEGNELNVFKGAASVLSEDRPAIVFEALTEPARTELIKFLSAFGYTVQRIAHDGACLTPDALNGTNNYLARHVVSL